MATEIIGREDELGVIEKLVAELPAGARRLAIEGEAGIGKTTIVDAAAAAARARGFRVLSARPVEAETTLSFAALRDLVFEPLPEILPSLPTPQRRALRAALLLEEPDAPPDEHTIAVAFLTSLQALARERPVLVVIDDAHWLDAASARAVAFAARRLSIEPVGVVVAYRDGAGAGAHLVADASHERVRLGPLSVGALHRLLHTRLGMTFPRPALRRLHGTSGGNPFVALELARGRSSPDDLPASVARLVEGRLERMPPETADALVAVAALARPTLELVAQLARSPETLEPALDARILEIHGNRVAFTHPLLASAAYTSAPVLRRRELHRRLADVVSDPEERAWHLARGADGDDPAVAAEVAAAADRARRRGAPAVAAELLEEARRLVDAGGAAAIAVEAADHHFAAGDTTRARTLLEEAVATLEPGSLRARAYAGLGRVHSFEDDLRAAIAHYERALAEPGGDAAVRARAHDGIASSMFRLREGLGRALDHARIAVETAATTGDGAVEAEATFTRALLERIVGSDAAAAVAARALELQPFTECLRITQQPRFGHAIDLLWTDDVVGARTLLTELVHDAEELGDESALPYVYAHLSLADCLEGDLAAALRDADEGLNAAVQTAQRPQLAFVLSAQALAAAHAGQERSARDAAARALDLARASGAAVAEINAASALAALDLARGDAEAVADRLVPLAGRLDAAGVVEPGTMRFVPDAADALVLLGRLDEAERVIRTFAVRAARLGRESALAGSARARGLVAAARGDAAAAVAELERALDHHSHVAMPIERARTLIGLGRVQRRAKQRAAARAALGEAVRELEACGALLWAEQARAELGRIGGRVASADALTAAEQRVAALVAEGRTNREVAAALFVTDRTVEGHLSRIYRKLGVRSRAELVRRLGAGAP